MTQTELANKVNIHARTLQRYENNKRVPRADIAQKIARELHTTVEDLF